MQTNPRSFGQMVVLQNRLGSVSLSGRFSFLKSSGYKESIIEFFYD